MNFLSFIVFDILFTLSIKFELKKNEEKYSKEKFLNNRFRMVNSKILKRRIMSVSFTNFVIKLKENPINNIIILKFNNKQKFKRFEKLLLILKFTIYLFPPSS